MSGVASVLFMTSALLLLTAAVLLGRLHAQSRATALTRTSTALSLWGASNLLVCLPFFSADPATWFETFFSGLLFTGWFSFLVHSVPYLTAYRFSKKRLERRGQDVETRTLSFPR